MRAVPKDFEQDLIEALPRFEAYVRRRAPQLVVANDTHRSVPPLWATDLSQHAVLRVLEALHRGKALDLTGENLAKFLRHIGKCVVAEATKERARCGQQISIDAYENGFADPNRKDASTELCIDADGHDVALKAALAAAMLSLTEKQREAIGLHIYQGLTFRQCAKRLGVKTSTVSDHFYQAIEKLRAALKPELAKIQHVEPWAWDAEGAGTRTSPKSSSDDA